MQNGGQFRGLVYIVFDERVTSQTVGTMTDGGTVEIHLSVFVQAFGRHRALRQFKNNERKSEKPDCGCYVEEC